MVLDVMAAFNRIIQAAMKMLDQLYVSAMGLFVIEINVGDTFVATPVE